MTILEGAIYCFWATEGKVIFIFRKF